MYTQALSDGTPPIPLRHGSMDKAGIPRERHGDGAAITQFHGQGVLRDFDSNAVAVRVLSVEEFMPAIQKVSTVVFD